MRLFRKRRKQARAAPVPLLSRRFAFVIGDRVADTAWVSEDFGSILVASSIVEITDESPELAAGWIFQEGAFTADADS
jgi:hypothetical protein